MILMRFYWNKEVWTTVEMYGATTLLDNVGKSCHLCSQANDYYRVIWLLKPLHF